MDRADRTETSPDPGSDASAEGGGSGSDSGSATSRKRAVGAQHHPGRLCTTAAPAASGRTYLQAGMVGAPPDPLLAVGTRYGVSTMPGKRARSRMRRTCAASSGCSRILRPGLGCRSSPSLMSRGAPFPGVINYSPGRGWGARTGQGQGQGPVSHGHRIGMGGGTEGSEGGLAASRAGGREDGLRHG